MEELLKLHKQSIERHLLRDVLGFGYCDRYMIKAIQPFATVCFGEDFVAAKCISAFPHLLFKDYDAIRQALQRIVVMYPGVLAMRHFITIPHSSGLLESQDIVDKTSLQLACGARAFKHGHLLLDLKADVRGACDELQIVGKLMKRIIRCGGWFQTREAPHACVLYKQQFNVVIVLLGISNRKRSSLLLLYRIPHDLIKVIAKYVL